MAMYLTASNFRNQSSFIFAQQTRGYSSIKRRFCENKSGAFHLPGVNQQQKEILSNSLQVHSAWRSVRHQELPGGRRRRAWTRSSTLLEGKEEEDLKGQDEVVDVMSQESDCSNFNEQRDINTGASPVPPAKEQRPRKTSRRGGRLHWILGPLALLITGALPALWLPSPALFSGTATAGLLALNGLDATFNMGATAFLLMADSCARNRSEDVSLSNNHIPLGYKVWSFLVNLIGLAAPIALVVASLRGGVLEFYLQPRLQVLPGAALLGPYTLLLVVQWLAEALVWQWQSPVWPVLPLVYQGYRLLQLTRGVDLGVALDAPAWLVEAVKALVAWWVFVLGMQVMWVTWLVGNMQAQARNNSRK